MSHALITTSLKALRSLACKMYDNKILFRSEMVGVNGIVRRGTVSSYGCRLKRAPTCSSYSSVRRVPAPNARPVSSAPAPPPRALSIRTQFH
ncbi:hypothetical protein EVAR_51869_1 [Eumeta japonica]|uniref:Uncharacterized protein n=1 Tax=Eumeta variegata TaxID=151549 RepID=A0A4C1YNS8_EUMVA|nr:hypothetical protein EVAR_51869_1 [Eumeta japonica]